MKRIIYLFLLLLMQKTLPQKCCDALAMDACFDTAFTAGYVFKPDDHRFNKVYGPGMGNIITADGCYNFWRSWCAGAKISYWLAFGRTTFFKRRTFLQEIPVTFYLRTFCDIKGKLRLYASLGGGFAWIKEASYLGHVKQFRGIGEVEAGLNYPTCHCINFTTAVRYIFPGQRQDHLTIHRKIDVGGVDIRAGVGFEF